MQLHIKMSAQIMTVLRKYHLAEGKRTEALSYVWARVVRLEDRILVLVPHNAPVKLFAPDCFARQSGGNVQLQPDVLNGMLVKFAASDYNCLINVHDHWFDDVTRFSSIDDQDDVIFDHYLRTSFEPMLHQHSHIGPARKIFNLSLVLAQKGLDARLTDTRRKSRFLQATIFDVVGEQFERMSIGAAKPGSVTPEMFSRQQDFITPAQQSQLAQMTVALAGCGGLGSILAESLARVGFGGLVLIDDDVLDTSNLNRWQSGQPDQVGKSKAKLLAMNLRLMFPALRIKVLAKSLYDPHAETLIAGSSILVAGLDNDEARYFLNRVSLQYGIPYFDAGVAITASVNNFDMQTRYFSIIPGATACLDCSQIELYNRASTIDAFIDAPTARARRNAGYVIDIPQANTPSVYAINQRAASLLVTELLNYICEWRPLATSITESWRHGTFERLSRDIFPEKPNPDCAICSYYAGAGSSEPLPRPLPYRKQASSITEENHHG